MNPPASVANFNAIDFNTLLNRDRHIIQRKIREFKNLRTQNKNTDKIVADIQRLVSQSQANRAARLAALPQPQYDEALPVNQRHDDLKAAILAHQVVVICGETGSGKTTQLPKLCLTLGRGVAGLIGHTQPRRLAARSVANRIAEELNSSIGEAVGFKVRFTDHTAPSSYIKLMTDGILLAETQNDRYLNQYDTIIIDEAHERSLNIDFLLGYLKQILPRRPDLKVIITSATIDSDRFAQHFCNAAGVPAPVIDISGRTYPVEIRYRPLNEQEDDEREIEMETAIVDAVRELTLEGPNGDILVFLPGEREIRDTADALRGAALAHVQVLPLFARLSNEEQHRIFRPDGLGRRVILATNVAETSLTVPGIKYVIDTGLVRMKRYSPRAKVEQLLIEKISQASANQRSGRCGRVQSGVCVRLYAQDDFNGRSVFTDPEITRSNLAAVILRMAALNLGRVADFPFLEAPSGRLIADGFQILHELGAVTDSETLTQTGRELSRLPIDPKVGRMLLAGRDLGCLSELLIISSALSIQDPRERPFDKRQAAEQAHAPFNDAASDFLSYLNIWQFFQNNLEKKQTNKQLITLCHTHFLSHIRLREWREMHAQLTQIVTELFGTKPADFVAQAREATHLSVKQQQQNQQRHYENIHKALLTGLVGNIGMKAPEADHYTGARGSNFFIAPSSGLKKSKPKWLVAAELTETSKLYARCVAKVEPQWLETLVPHLLKYHYLDPHWDAARGEVIASERVTLYGLTLIPRRNVSYGRIAPDEAQELFIRAALVDGDYVFNAPFFQHNQQLISNIEKLEHKSRRQDVLIEPEALFDFYKEKLQRQPTAPPKNPLKPVTDAASFNAWRVAIEQETPRHLFISKEDLMRHTATHITEEQFPEWLLVEEGKLKLRYRFEPRHPLDGVTVDLPLAVLNRLNQGQLDWLVPGMVREKLQFIIKSLPKTLRRHFVPVPDFITAFLSSDINTQAPLLPQLTTFMRRHTGGVVVSETDFQLADLPEHCTMNLRVLDDAKQELGMGRDLLALQKQLGMAAQLTFRDASLDIERDDVLAWDFGELPTSIQFARGKQQLTGYPALALETKSGKAAVAIRLFDTETVARASHRLGVICLMQWQLKDHMKNLAKGWPQFTQQALIFRHLMHSDQLLADATAAICDRAFIGEDDLPMTEKAFTEQVKRARTRLPAVNQAVQSYLGQIAAEYQTLTPLIEKHRLANDLKNQLNHLIYDGFLAKTPWAILPSLPRYLKAMRLRMEKHAANPQRDGTRAAEVRELWQLWEKRMAEDRDRASPNPDIEAFRWQIEELRVGLFAQELKTPYPVSYKRLMKIWDGFKR